MAQESWTQLDLETEFSLSVSREEIALGESEVSSVPSPEVNLGGEIIMVCIWGGRSSQRPSDSLSCTAKPMKVLLH